MSVERVFGSTAADVSRSTASWSRSDEVSVGGTPSGGLAGFVEDAGARGQTVVHLVADGAVAASFALADVVREESREAVRRLGQLGIEVAMLTGDSRPVAHAVAEELGIRTFFCGPESFTPDLQPVVGEAPEVRNYFVAAGLNSIGILTGGGLGRALAHWVVDGRPDIDVTGMNIDRLHSYQSTPEYRATRTVESLGMVYQCHYPTRSMQTARGAKTSPLHDRLAARGAYFRDVSGWEGADWYAPAGESATVDTLSWGRQPWFDWWAAEHRAARENVICMDMSFMSKLLVQGRDATPRTIRMNYDCAETETTGNGVSGFAPGGTGG
mgnify:CR=1 FL=1